MDAVIAKYAACCPQPPVGTDAARFELELAAAHRVNPGEHWCTADMGSARGLGLVALAPIPPGAVVTEYSGHRSRHPPKVATHTIRVPACCGGPDMFIDGLEVANLVRDAGRTVGTALLDSGVAALANSAAAPNCRFDWTADGRCFLVCHRGAKPGDELTARYTWKDSEGVSRIGKEIAI